MEKENYFFDFDAEASSDKIFALVIFDITDNRDMATAYRSPHLK